MSDEVSPVTVNPPNPHPGAGPDPSDFYWLSDPSPYIDTGSYTTVDTVDVAAIKQKPNVNVNINLDLNKALADLAEAFKSDADRREADGAVKFDGLNSVSELTITSPGPIPGFPAVLGEEYTLFLMRDATFWLDTDQDGMGDLHFRQNQRTGSWYYDRDSNGTFDTLVTTSGDWW